MIKELFLTASALTSMGVPCRSSQVRSNEQETTIEEEQGYSVIENGMKIHYRYETNEVNSVSDLISGNAYHFKIEDNNTYSIFDSQNTYFSFLFFNINNYDLVNFYYDEILNTSYTDNGLLCARLEIFETDVFLQFYLTYNENNDYVFDISSVSQDNFSLEGDCVFKNGDISKILDYSIFSKCENIPIDYVERVYPTNLMGNIASFIDEYLLSGIPLIDSVTGSINGTNVTMRAWLCSMICIVIACLLIWLAIIFIKWLFKLMSGCFSRL